MFGTRTLKMMLRGLRIMKFYVKEEFERTVDNERLMIITVDKQKPHEFNYIIFKER